MCLTWGRRYTDYSYLVSPSSDQEWANSHADESNLCHLFFSLSSSLLPLPRIKDGKKKAPEGNKSSSK